MARKKQRPTYVTQNRLEDSIKLITDALRAFQSLEVANTL